MPRSTNDPKSIGRTIDYIIRDSKEFLIHNFFSSEAEKIKTDLYENSLHIKKAVGKNFFYHEVISITRSSQLTEKQQIRYLTHLARQYIQTRCPHALAVGGIHAEKDNNLHIHLFFSANNAAARRRNRLSKKIFSDAKKGLENYCREKFPELEQQLIINQTKTHTQKKAARQERERQLKKRSRRQSQKDQIKDKLLHIFANALDADQFYQKLAENGYQFYHNRGNLGIFDQVTQRKYRFRNLGVLDEFKAFEAKVLNPEISVYQNFKREKVTIRRQEDQSPQNNSSKTTETPTPESSSTKPESPSPEKPARHPDQAQTANSKESVKIKTPPPPHTADDKTAASPEPPAQPPSTEDLKAQHIQKAKEILNQGNHDSLDKEKQKAKAPPKKSPKPFRR